RSSFSDFGFRVSDFRAQRGLLLSDLTNQLAGGLVSALDGGGAEAELVFVEVPAQFAARQTGDFHGQRQHAEKFLDALLGLLLAVGSVGAHGGSLSDAGLGIRPTFSISVRTA